jgi:hypothetical protein
MTSFRKIRVIAYLVLLFAAGTALGLGWSQMKRPAWTQSPEWAQRWLERRMRSDFEAIKAAPEQQAELRPLYDQLLADFRVVQQEAEGKLNAAFGRFGLEMSRKVTPEQLEILREKHQRPKTGSGEKPSQALAP